MRFFIILCFAAAVTADKLGYNYRPVDHSSSGLSFTPGSGGVGGVSGGIGGGSDGFGSGGLSGFAAGGDDGSYGSSGSLGGLTGVGSGFDSGAQSIVSPVSHGVNKEFFSFSAPEDEFEDAEGAQQLANSLKKNVRVIFIKGPENNGLEKAALALARNAAEQKTAIYVLQKQHDIADLANKLQSVNDNRNHHPEVHFVKYRNQDDLVNAKRTIQSQYDQEPGASQNYNHAVAPVINFASPSAPIQSYGQQQQYYHPAASNTNTNYLPPSLLRRLRF
ncbi:PREDICTED: keratin, type II cytoskeletal 1b-like [Bactrocera latifrons]|nr:PREDICTED: keratin, type II cytoskeletal 1b-like [Bactrocera latifrons]